MLDMSDRELETAVDSVRENVFELRDRIKDLDRELCTATTEIWKDIERLKAAVQELQATLGLPHLVGEP